MHRICEKNMKKLETWNSATGFTPISRHFSFFLHANKNWNAKEASSPLSFLHHFLFFSRSVFIGKKKVSYVIKCLFSSPPPKEETVALLPLCTLSLRRGSPALQHEFGLCRRRRRHWYATPILVPRRIFTARRHKILERGFLVSRGCSIAWGHQQ